MDYFHLDYLIDRLMDVKKYAKSYLNGEFARPNPPRDDEPFEA